MLSKLRRWLREGAILLVVLAGVIILLDVWRSPQMPAMFDSTPLHTLDGETVTLASISEERPVLLYFWASWCGICRFTTPDVSRLQSEGESVMTAIAPAIWGSTYIVTTQYLPNFSPMTVAMLRALPAGLLLVMIVRQIPTGIWWMRIFILGALNISLFWSLLFISVYRLPGGVAATVGAVQPLMVVFISAALLGSPIRLMAVLGAICGTAGVALLVLTPNAALDPVGVAAGLAGAVSMAFGTVLTRKWQPPVPLLTFTAWQLAAGGLLLVPVALVFDPPIPMPTGTNVLGLAWLGLIGAGLTYFLWFRGISRLEPTVVSLLGFLSPGTAVLLGWLFLDQTLSALQIIGVLLVIGSIWLGQRSNRTPRARIACRKSP